MVSKDNSKSNNYYNDAKGVMYVFLKMCGQK